MRTTTFIKRYFNIKRNINILNTYYNIYKRNIIITNYPIQAFIEPTANCNIRCPLCPTGLKLPDRHTGTLSLEKYKYLIDEIGDYILILNLYNWGEPTLHKDFPKMIKYASDKGIITTASSNFSRNLDDEYLKDLAKSGLDILIVSLDGLTQESYEKYRRGGDIRVVLQNVKNLHDIKIKHNIKTPHIKLNFFVFKHNEHEIEEMKRIYKSLGSDELTISRAYIPDNSEIESPSNQLYKPLSKNNSISETCSQLYYSFVYNPDEYISPCCNISSTKLDFLKYNNEGIKIALNSEKFQEARKYFKYRKNNINNTTMDGLIIKSSENCNNICTECPTSDMQRGHINYIQYFISDIFNLIKEYLSENKQEYIRLKWRRLKS